MTTSYGGATPGITGTHYGRGDGLGMPGALIPSAGVDGPGYLYAGLSLPADAAKEIRGPITRWPSGTLTVYEDSAFTYVGSTDYALYQLYVDGVASTADIGNGPGIGRINFSVGATSSGDLSGNVTLSDFAVAGSFAGGSASAVSGNVTLGDFLPAGLFSVAGASDLSGNVTLVDFAPAGMFYSVAPQNTGPSAPPIGRRVSTRLRAPRNSRTRG
jgi:hypothetical protein